MIHGDEAPLLGCDVMLGDVAGGRGRHGGELLGDGSLALVEVLLGPLRAPSALGQEDEGQEEDHAGDVDPEPDLPLPR